MDMKNFTYVVVGAGFWGGVMAERIAEELQEAVLVLERRTHLGGNSGSSVDPRTGIECHNYGTHIFHTRLPEVWEYVNRFSSFTTYRHKVLTTYRDRVYPMPISLATINSFFGLNLKPREVAEFIRSQIDAVSSGTAANLEEKAVSLIGRPLYEAFIKGYTWKQWQTDPVDLPPEIITRLPVRPSYNTDYFNDPRQGMPTEGYDALFRRLFAHPRIKVCLGVDYRDVAGQLSPDCRIFYTGPIDAFFDHALGRLEWRSLRFEKRVEEVCDWQGTSVMNYADMEVPWTRIHEFKHLHPERAVFESPVTVLSTEYPAPCGPDDEPYYPINTSRNMRLLEQYRERAATIPNLTFGGRLGLYRYLDMDQTIADALQAFNKLKTQIPRR